jgi:hypothetical protein
MEKTRAQSHLPIIPFSRTRENPDIAHLSSDGRLPPTVRRRDFKPRKVRPIHRFAFAVIGFLFFGLALLTAASVVSAPRQPASSSSVHYLDGSTTQKERAFSPAVITRGGKIVWLAGQSTTEDLDGKSLVGDFHGQAKTDFASMDRTLKRSGVRFPHLQHFRVTLCPPSRPSTL